MFRSYETGRQDFVTLVMNINGLQETQAGPNYSPISSDFVYNIHVENSGDAVEDLTFQFVPGARFSGPFDAKKGTGEGLKVGVPWRAPIRQQKVALSHIGQVQKSGSTFDESALNYKEHYLLRVFTGAGQAKPTVDDGPFATNTNGGSSEFRIPYSYAGNKTFPGTDAGVDDYAGYANTFIYDINIPGCALPGRVFVGQRQEPFNINLGQTFDLINYNPTTGAEQSDAFNSLARKAITTFAVEVPASCLSDGANVIGGWTSVQHLGHVGPTQIHVAGAQKNRLGNPLVNELFVGLTDKDSFNANHPRNDVNFKDYIDYPTLPEIIDILFGSGAGAASLAPQFYPRVDLTTVLLQGIPALAPLGNFGTQQALTSPQQCGSVATPPFADMLRLNLVNPATPTAKGSQNQFGVIGDGATNNGNDLSGYPNGRRPGDDIVDIFLRVGMGALCNPPFDALLGICNSTVAPLAAVPLTDHAPVTDQYFDDVFPYLRPPTPGSLERCP